ncbi:hypothetical protein E4T56_gene12766 [Termitomyces sp. T112]|nr:hypothetical protein E4T56_gene12766 [Termitomyces sp. T112]
MAGDLKPTTAKAITMGRYYGQATLVEPFNMVIEPALFSVTGDIPQYLPPKWTVHVQPEGQRYFFKDTDIRIVSMNDVYDPKVLEKIDYWTEKLMDILDKQAFSLSDDIELFLQIEGVDCHYYFVNHRTHVEFWLDDNLSTDELGIDPVVSASHLKLAQHELYWVHVELFPVHLRSFAPHILEELIGYFSQGWADQLTSSNSTNPYSAQQCAEFVKLLRSVQGQPQNSNTRWIVGRLWALAFQQRFRTHYGEQVVQLCRNQSILVDRYGSNVRESRVVDILMSLLTFKASDGYVSRLNALHVDWISYEYDWILFMKKCLNDWKYMSCLAFLSPLSYYAINTMPTLLFLSMFSGFCFSASFISSILLIHRHESLENGTAGEAANYLGAVRSKNFKFQWVAFVYALPKTFLLWGIIGSICNCLFGVAALCDGGTSLTSPTCIYYFCGTTSFCLLAIIAFQDVTSDQKILQFPSFHWRRSSKQESVSLAV